MSTRAASTVSPTALTRVVNCNLVSTCLNWAWILFRLFKWYFSNEQKNVLLPRMCKLKFEGDSRIRRGDHRLSTSSPHCTPGPPHVYMKQMVRKARAEKRTKRRAQLSDGIIIIVAFGENFSKVVYHRPSASPTKTESNPGNAPIGKTKEEQAHP